MKRPTYWTAAFFVLLLFMAVPKDRARRMVWKYGRRLRGPELVTTAEFNEKLGRKKMADDLLPGRDRVHQSGTELGATGCSTRTGAAGCASRASARRCTS